LANPQSKRPSICFFTAIRVFNGFGFIAAVADINSIADIFPRMAAGTFVFYRFAPIGLGGVELLSFIP
jgi:hypothetical protein